MRIDKGTQWIFPFYLSLLAALGLFLGFEGISKIVVYLIPTLQTYVSLLFVVVYGMAFVASYMILRGAKTLQKYFVIASVIIWAAFTLGYLLR